MPSKAWIQDFSSLLHRMSIHLHRLIGNPFLTLQNNFNNDFSTICTGLWCFDPDTAIASCKLVVPFDYTTCGTGKVSTRGDWLIDWVLIVSRIFHSHGEVIECRCYASRFVEQWGFFSVQQILLHGKSVSRTRHIQVWEGYCYNLGAIFVEAGMEHPTLCVHASYLQPASSQRSGDVLFC